MTTDIFALFDQIGASSRAPAGPVTHLVVGLGNPEPQYAGTRHNAGFVCLDALARAAGVRVTNAKFSSLVSDATVSGKHVLLMKPQTLMNASGLAVAEAAKFYRIPPEHIIVLCDDIHFAVGHARIRLRGSHGGHNGLRSIESCLSSEDYIRLRVGVGQKPSPEYDLADWVLGRFPAEELRTLTEQVAPAMAEAVTLILAGKPEDAMTRFSK